LLSPSGRNLFGQGLLAAFHLGAVFVLARVLGRDGLGTYYLFFALILVVQLITEVGTNTVLTCRIVRRPAFWRDAVAEAAGLYSIVAAASVGVFLGFGAL
jgi:O-antigen/teichoic acid export membrane protein